MQTGMSWPPANGIKQQLEPQALDLVLGKHHRDESTHPVLLGVDLTPAAPTAPGSLLMRISATLRCTDSESAF